jgi:hypothetical protein
MILVLALLAGCSDSGAAPHALASADEPPAASTLELRVGESFREYGVRKTVLVGETSAGPVTIVALRASPGLRVPELTLPFVARNRLVLELEWLEDATSGQVALELEGGARERVFDVAY